MLVENSVYLKFLTSSSKYLQISSKKRANDAEQFEKQTQEAIKAQHRTSSKTNLIDMDANESLMSSPNSSTNTASQNESNNSAPGLPNSKKPRLNEQSNKNDESKSQINNSFVIIKLDTQHVPYVSLQFIFHSSISYYDRMQLLDKFKAKMFGLNAKNASSSIAQMPVSTPSMGSTTNVQQASSGVTLPPINLSFDEQKLSSEHFEFCQLLHKPDLYDTLKKVFYDAHLNNLNKLKGDKASVKTQKIINFMQQRKFKWVLDKRFSHQISQTLKEAIIDTFVRMRLKEGFKCLFQNPKFAVFTLQLTMFDLGDLSSSSQTEAINSDSKGLSSGKATFKNGSSQICTFVYVVRFFNASSVPDPLLENYVHNFNTQLKQQTNFNFHYDGNSSPSKARILTNNTGLLNIVTNTDNSNLINYLGNSKKIAQNGIECSELDGSQENNFETQNEVYFTTEIYYEAVDGIYQERKSTNATSNSLNQKKAKEKYKYLKNFRNLTNMEIANLVYLSDLKCFSTLQSSYALFLSKSSSISNLSSLLDLKPAHLLNTNQPISSEALSNIYDYNASYFDCIRILPDLNTIPKNSISKHAKNNKMSSVRSTYLHNRIKLNKITLRQSKSIACTRPEMENNKSNQEDKFNSFDKQSKLYDSKEQLLKKKKNEIISLHEQLRPVLDCVETHGSSLIDVDFRFTLRGVLLESSLYVCVFEDVPLTLFNQSVKSQVYNENEMLSIKNIQNLFFKNIDELFKKHDLPTQVARSCFEQEYNSYDLVVESMKKEIKNAMILKLSDIKSGGDAIAKQIIDDLKMQISVESHKTAEDSSNKTTCEKNFEAYLKFNVVQATAKLPPPSSSSNNQAYQSKNSLNDFNYNSLSSNVSKASNFSHQHSDIENNRFFIFGLFFLNSANQTGAHSSNEKYSKQSSTSSSSNRLVFFLFNSVPENIKDSLINTNTNTCVIRKSLFSTQKVFQKSSFGNDSTPNPKVSLFDSYRFFCSKNGHDRKSSNDLNAYKASSNSGNSTFNTTTIPTPTNLIKKIYNISDILKFHLMLNSPNYAFLLSYIDYIEETCAKSYIKSLIHYMAIYSINHSQRIMDNVQFVNPIPAKTFAISDESSPDPSPKTSITEDDFIKKFESQSINQLLKIGKKKLLIDLDLTDYLKIICKHVGLNKLSHNNEFSSATPKKSSTSSTGSNKDSHKAESTASEECKFDWSKCSVNENKIKYEYLEKKFDELFLKNFNLLPGFNDLFIFTSVQQNTATKSNQSFNENNDYWNSRQKSNLVLIDQELVESPSSHYHDNDEENDDLGYFYNDYDNSSISSSNESSISNSDDEDDEHMRMEQEDANSLAEHDFDDCSSYYYDNSDRKVILDEQFDNDASSHEETRKTNDYECLLTKDGDEFLGLVVEKAKSRMPSKEERTNLQRRRSSKLKFSSPYSNSNIRLKKRTQSGRSRTSENRISFDSKLMTQTSILESNLMNEQIIELEFVTIIGANSATSLDGLDELDLERRTRTTTLTPDNNIDQEASTQNQPTSISENNDAFVTNLNASVENSANITVIDSNGASNNLDKNANSSKLNISTKKNIFFSKFSKFNLACLLDLVQEADLDEFKKLIEKLELNSNELDLGNKNGSSLCVNDLKVYLRFNWYSFSDLDINNSSRVVPNTSSKILVPGSSGSELNIKLQNPQLSGSSILQNQSVSSNQSNIILNSMLG